MTNEQLTHIRAALADNADDITKQRGINACRTIIAALGGKVGQPMEAPAPPAAPPPSPIENAARMAATAPPTLILDAVIAKLKAHLSTEQAEAEAAPAPKQAALRIPFIPVPTLGQGA